MELEERIRLLEAENRRLTLTVNANQVGRDERTTTEPKPAEEPNNIPRHNQSLSTEQIERYSRQLLLQSGFRVTGQAKLLDSSVLVVGAGGIGSTAILYLAAFGVGRIGIVDFDAVEISNLHRQIIHRQDHVGMNKAYSARKAVESLNPLVDCRAIPERLDHQNAIQYIKDYDLVVDASDNPQTRYLVNDACVIAGKPLVSGSAVEVEGQLTVYNHNGGPCYRCLYPKPAVSVSCGRSCADAGVLGPVPGLVGILQAMEAVKIVTSTGETMEQRMLHYNALQTSFVSFKKPSKRITCPVCGPEPTIRSMEESRINIEQAQGNGGTCAASPGAANMSPEHSISCNDFMLIHESGEPHVLLDVRVEQQYELCSLRGSINIPLADIPKALGRIEDLSAGTKPIYCMCRRGIASAEATRLLLDSLAAYPGIHSVHNIRGGLQAWHETVDTSFPNY